MTLCRMFGYRPAAVSKTCPNPLLQGITKLYTLKEESENGLTKSLGRG